MLYRTSALAFLGTAGCCGWGDHHCFKDVVEPCRESLEVTVVEVIDGDTFDVEPPIELPDGSSVDRVRLLCVDTPETSGDSECYGHEARDWLAEKLEGEQVTLHFAEDCLGIYGRALAYVQFGHRLVNLELAQEGYALPIDEWFADYACCDQIRTAVEQAQADELGGWGECSGSPWEY